MKTSFAGWEVKLTNKNGRRLWFCEQRQMWLYRLPSVTLSTADNKWGLQQGRLWVCGGSLRALILAYVTEKLS
jgi:hypothetical protein